MSFSNKSNGRNIVMSIKKNIFIYQSFPIYQLLAIFNFLVYEEKIFNFVKMILSTYRFSQNKPISVLNACKSVKRFTLVTM